MSALAALSLFLVISSGLSHPRNDRPNVRPEYLDHLLKTKQYDVFAEIMNIPDVSLVRPKEGERSEYPMFNKDLEMGDIVPAFGPLKEESRLSIRYERYPGSQWPNGYIPYHIVKDDFSPYKLEKIYDAIDYWNSNSPCLKLVPVTKEDDDYLLIMNRTGCWSYLGRIGGPQALSLQENGCLHQGIIVHEILHAAGFAHVQNRPDRNDYIDILWENIPEDWHSQYEMVDPRYFKTKSVYDYYSLMHYRVEAPETGKPAFIVKAENIDERRMGRGNEFTKTDIANLNNDYC